MIVLWSYFWPIFAAALITGLFAGILAHRRTGRRHIVRGGGLVVALALTALWHGPLGAGQRLSSNIEVNTSATLAYYELPAITARLHHSPLTRRVILSGPADDFQRRELPATMDTLPGVASTRWAPAGGGVPLIAEAAGMAVLGFLFGLLLAYLVELHRRHNAQWNW
ncbi:MAG: hypothetical protein ABIW33_04765 [Sphingomicrobium sp.]